MMNEAQLPVILALDVGTHSVRAAAVSSQNRLLAVEEQYISLSHSSSTQYEQDPEEIILSLYAVIEKILAHGYNVVSAALAVQRSSVIAWRAEIGQPLSPVLNWLDTRNEEFVQTMAHRGSQIQSISGLVLSSHYGASKIKWLQEQLESKSLHIGPLSSFVIDRLINDNQYVCDEGNAARTQLYDIHLRTWSEELCNIFGVRQDILPQVKAMMDDYGHLIQDNIPLKLVCGDQNAAYFSLRSNCQYWEIDEKEAIFVNIGSGAFVIADFWERQSNPQLLQSLMYSDAQKVQYALEGTVNGAGVLLDQLCEKWCRESNRYADDFYAAIDYWLTSNKGVFKDLPVFINTEGGLGSPFWKSGLESVWVNEEGLEELSLIERTICVIESIAFLIAINIEIIQEDIPDARAIVCGGGVSRVSGLCQCISDITQSKVYVSTEKEATLLGLAVMVNGHTSDHCEKPLVYSPEKNDTLLQRYQIFKSFLTCFVKAHDGLVEV